MANILYLSERPKSGLHDLKVAILIQKSNNVLGGQKSLKLRNCSVIRIMLLLFFLRQRLNF